MKKQTSSPSSPSKQKLFQTERKIAQYLSYQLSSRNLSKHLKTGRDDPSSSFYQDEDEYRLFISVVAQSFHSHFIPHLNLEVTMKIVSLMSGRALISFSSCCRSAYHLALAQWPIFIGRKMEKLQLLMELGLMLIVRTEVMQRRRGYVLLKRVFEPCHEALVKVRMLEREKEERLRDDVERIFVTKLGLPSPWRSSLWTERLLEDMEDFRVPSDITVQMENLQSGLLNVTLNIQDGFYKGEVVDFTIKVSEAYPLLRPQIYIKSKAPSSTPIYHPFIDPQTGLIMTPKATTPSNPCSLPDPFQGKRTISEVILTLHSLFHENYLTNYFTL